MAKKKKKQGSEDLGVLLAVIAGSVVMVGVLSLPFILATPDDK